MNAQIIRRTTVALACLLVLGSLSARADTAAEQCAAVTDKAARLACFDALFQKPATPDPLPEVEASKAETVEAESPKPVVADQHAEQPTEQSTDLLAETVPVTVPAAPAPAPDTTVAQTEPSGAEVNANNKLFGWRKKIEFESTIKAVRTRDKQRMLFQLANDEIWMQSTPRNLPIKVGDAVTIKSTLVGGYMLRNADGVGTRVKRIQ